MSQVTHLASGPLNRSGDTLTVELVQPDSMSAVVRIVWPAKPLVTARPHLKRSQRWRPRWSGAWRRRKRSSPRLRRADDCELLG